MEIYFSQKIAFPRTLMPAERFIFEQGEANRYSAFSNKDPALHEIIIVIESQQ